MPTNVTSIIFPASTTQIDDLGARMSAAEGTLTGHAGDIAAHDARLDTLEPVYAATLTITNGTAHVVCAVTSLVVGCTYRLVATIVTAAVPEQGEVLYVLVTRRSDDALEFDRFAGGARVDAVQDGTDLALVNNDVPPHDVKYTVTVITQ